MEVIYYVVESGTNLIGPVSEVRAKKLAEELGRGATVRPLTSLSSHHMAQRLLSMSPEQFEALTRQRAKSSEAKAKPPK